MAHIFSVLLCVYILYLAQPGTSLFSWHPTFMVIGFGLFMFEAILIFSRHSSILNTADRKTKTKYHWILQIISLVFILLGFAAIFINKNQNDRPHFTTWHAQIGLAAICMASFQAVAGFSLVYTLNFLNPLGTSLAVRKKMHAMFGTIVFLLGFAAMFLSLYSSFVLTNTGNKGWYILLALITMVTSIVVNQVSDAYLLKNK